MPLYRSRLRPPVWVPSVPPKILELLPATSPLPIAAIAWAVSCACAAISEMLLQELLALTKMECAMLYAALAALSSMFSKHSFATRANSSSLPAIAAAARAYAFDSSTPISISAAVKALPVLIRYSATSLAIWPSPSPTFLASSSCACALSIFAVRTALSASSCVIWLSIWASSSAFLPAMNELTTSAFNVSCPSAATVALFRISGYTDANSSALSKDIVKPSATWFCKLARVWKESETELIVLEIREKLFSALV